MKICQILPETTFYDESESAVYFKRTSNKEVERTTVKVLHNNLFRYRTTKRYHAKLCVVLSYALFIFHIYTSSGVFDARAVPVLEV